MSFERINLKYNFLKMKNKFAIILILVGVMLLSCHRQKPAHSEKAPLIPVKTTRAFRGEIEKNLQYYGKTIYQKRNSYVAPISGYISEINITYGEHVAANEKLFVLQTKESKALKKNSTNAGGFGFVTIEANTAGFVSQQNFNATGDYLTEGTLVCVVVEDQDVMIQANVAYANVSILHTGMICKLLLSDNSIKKAEVFRILPTVDATSQTQQVLIKPVPPVQLPENLHLIVQFSTMSDHSKILISKSAVLTNETQTEFWLMKITNDSIAVRLPIIKGTANDSLVEILSPELDLKDRFINEGAYGLPDSAIVKIVK
jgi:hypothetical protein